MSRDLASKRVIRKGLDNGQCHEWCTEPSGLVLRRYDRHEDEEGSTRIVFVGCGRCLACRRQRAKVRAAKVLDWMDALSVYPWGRGISVLITFTLSPEDGDRRGKAGRARLQKALARVKSEMRRQLPSAARIVLSVRCYELHQDGAIHAHLVMVIEGPVWYPNARKLAEAAACGRFSIKTKRIKREHLQEGFGYATKYVLKGEVIIDPEYKGTRWYQIWSARHRTDRKSSIWKLASREARWKCRKVFLKVSGQWYSAVSVARWCTSSQVGLIRGSGTAGFLPYLSPRPPSSSILLR